MSFSPSEIWSYLQYWTHVLQMYYNFLSNWNVFRTFACYDEMYAYENKRVGVGAVVLGKYHRLWCTYMRSKSAFLPDFVCHRNDMRGCPQFRIAWLRWRSLLQPWPWGWGCLRGLRRRVHEPWGYRNTADSWKWSSCRVPGHSDPVWCSFDGGCLHSFLK